MIEMWELLGHDKHQAADKEREIDHQFILHQIQILIFHDPNRVFR